MKSMMKPISNRWRYVNRVYYTSTTFKKVLILLGIIDLKWKLYDGFWRWARKIQRRWNRLVYKPIYYLKEERDCDMYESSYIDVWEEGRKAFMRYQQRCYEGAEGPIYFEIVTKEQYEAHKDEVYHRDRIMEAYENGNGRSIYV